MDIINKYGPLIATKLKMGLATNLNGNNIVPGINPECEPIQHIYSDCFQSVQKNASLDQHMACLKYCETNLEHFQAICKSFKKLYPNQSNFICHDSFSTETSFHNIYNDIKNFNHQKNYFNSNIQPVSFTITDDNSIGPHYRPDEKKFVINKNNCIYFIPSFMTILLCHECYPGHHYMNSFCKSFPSFEKQDNMALIEGWGFYSERFCPETVENYFAYCCCKCLHIIRAIVDIHYTQLKDWNQEKCIQFILSNWPFSISFNQAKEELNKCIDRPGVQACYVTGERFYDQCLKTYANQFNTLQDYHNQLFIALNSCHNCSTQSIETFFKKN